MGEQFSKVSSTHHCIFSLRKKIIFLTIVNLIIFHAFLTLTLIDLKLCSVRVWSKMALMMFPMLSLAWVVLRLYLFHFFLFFASSCLVMKSRTPVAFVIVGGQNPRISSCYEIARNKTLWHLKKKVLCCGYSWLSNL